MSYFPSAVENVRTRHSVSTNFKYLKTHIQLKKEIDDLIIDTLSILD